jgi:copper resistance protein B
VSPTGQLSGRVSGTTDFLLTQRLIVQPRAELHAAVQRAPEFLIAPGVNDVELGVRLRYEFRRDLAPYVGLTWFRRTGGAAGLARAAGEADREAGLVMGLRVWR